MQPHKILIGIAMVSLFITAGLFVMFGTAEDSEDGLFDSYADISERVNEFNRTKFEDIEEGGQSTGEAVYNISSIQKDDLDEEIDTTKEWNIGEVGVIKLIMRLFSYFNLMGIMVSDIGKILHIPQMFLDFAMIIFLITLLFTMAYFIYKFQLRND